VREGGNGVHGFGAIDCYEEDIRGRITEDERVGGGRLCLQGGSHCGDGLNVS
jgi:hypothetical protein